MERPSQDHLQETRKERITTLATEEGTATPAKFLTKGTPKEEEKDPKREQGEGWET